ncbi:MAG: uracil-DNA glycosylase [Pseudomonadota bacterium]
MYWGRPVPSFGDPSARLLVVGLAPGAHGANRTGRLFTGDRSGAWLFRAMYRSGFANQPTSKHRNDGLELRDAYVTAVVRCAPPDNKPTITERDSCMPYLESELRLLMNLRVVVCLGAFAWNVIKGRFITRNPGLPKLGPTKFAHGAEVAVSTYLLLASYHPSQQNTFTGRLTEEMLDSVFRRAREIVESPGAFRYQEVT